MIHPLRISDIIPTSYLIDTGSPCEPNIQKSHNNEHRRLPRTGFFTAQKFYYTKILTGLILISAIQVAVLIFMNCSTHKYL